MEGAREEYREIEKEGEWERERETISLAKKEVAFAKCWCCESEYGVLDRWGWWRRCLCFFVVFIGNNHNWHKTKEQLDCHPKLPWPQR